MADDAIEPDTKDWTWVLTRPCDECGYDAASVAGPQVADRVVDLAERWVEVLARPDATVRPAPFVWSPLEYACHVRDVFGVFTGRVNLMLDQDDPTFPNWDQDETALAERYSEQEPAVVSSELLVAAHDTVAAFRSVPADAWGRTGVRSNGSRFTLESLGQYFLHDVVHHLADVRG
ncbi:MAG TPA: DinB family protein [Actinotalea sp.]|jgi:hypothetical protein